MGWLSPHPSADGRHLVLYDGVCGLCDRTVQFLLTKDRGGVLSFAPLQGETARRALERLEIPEDGQTMVLVRDFGGAAEEVLVRSRAVLATLDLVGGVWRPLARLLRLLPRPLADALYRWIATHRYRWFGRFDSCKLPPPEVRERFLE